MTHAVILPRSLRNSGNSTCKIYCRQPPEMVRRDAGVEVIEQEPMSLIGTFPTCRGGLSMSVHRGWSQPVDATLYLGGKRWSVGWNEDFIEVLLRQRRRSYGIAGSAGSR